MRFMMFVIHDDSYSPPAELDAEAVAWSDEVDGQKIRVMGQRLAPADEGKVIQVQNGETIVSDGPWVKQADQIDGFDILECDSQEAAIAAAAKHPMAKLGMIEVRAFWGE